VAVLPHQVVGPPAHPLHRPRLPGAVVHMFYRRPVNCAGMPVCGYTIFMIRVLSGSTRTASKTRVVRMS
jgi:hypothetical protein